MNVLKNFRYGLKILLIIPLLVAFSFASVALAQEEQPETEMAARNFAAVEQRQQVRARDLTQFDDPNVRARWCDNDAWIVRGGETLGHIVINCDIPLANLLAVNPQISDPDLVFAGEIVNLPSQTQREEVVGMPDAQLTLTAAQEEYFSGLIAQAEEAGIPVTGEVAEDIAGRNMAADNQRLAAQERDLTRFDDPNVRERWCGEDWVIMPGETLGHISILCNIPLDVLLAHNPQISNPDVVVDGEIVTIPDDPFATPRPLLTQAQREYLEANFGLEPVDTEPDVEDEDEAEEGEEEEGEGEEEGEDEGNG